jgi:GxxExxY protein
LDLPAEGKVIVELKTVDTLLPVHTAQLLTYLKLTGLKRGLLINFKVERLVDGVKRVSL